MARSLSSLASVPRFGLGTVVHTSPFGGGSAPSLAGSALVKATLVGLVAASAQAKRIVASAAVAADTACRTHDVWKRMWRNSAVSVRFDMFHLEN
jgi:hypothetical protein